MLKIAFVRHFQRVTIFTVACVVLVFEQLFIFNVQMSTPSRAWSLIKIKQIMSPDYPSIFSRRHSSTIQWVSFCSQVVDAAENSIAWACFYRWDIYHWLRSNLLNCSRVLPAHTIFSASHASGPKNESNGLEQPVFIFAWRLRDGKYVSCRLIHATNVS